VQRLEAAIDGACAGHLPDRHRIAGAFDGYLSEHAVFEEFAEQTASGAGDEHGVRLGLRLKPRRKIGGLADHRFLPSRIFADQVAHDDRAGGDANPHMQFGTNICLDAGHGFDQR
jgi:hypothetical protein